MAKQRHVHVVSVVIGGSPAHLMEDVWGVECCGIPLWLAGYWRSRVPVTVLLYLPRAAFCSLLVSTSTCPKCVSVFGTVAKSCPGDMWEVCGRGAEERKGTLNCILFRL